MPNLPTNGPLKPTRFYVSNPTGANLTGNIWNTIHSPFKWEEDSAYPNDLANQFSDGTFTPTTTGVYLVIFQLYTDHFPAPGYAELSLISGDSVWRTGPLAAGVPTGAQVAVQFSGMVAMSGGTGYSPAIYVPRDVNPKLYNHGHADDSNYCEIMRLA